MLLSSFLRGLVRVGTLSVVDAHGATHVFGAGPPRAGIRLHSPSLHWRLALHPDLAFGEAYMDGSLTVTEGSLAQLLDMLGANVALCDGAFDRVGMLIDRIVKPLAEFNPIWRARRNVAHHYDLTDALFDLFLDRDRQYSCGYFQAPNDSLEEAQAAKKRHLAAKLCLAPGMRVLDIGSGWGGLALYLAEAADVDVLGITLSKEQLRYARGRASAAGLADRVRFELCDYREVEGRFDRVVSVGMFEHVGTRHYPGYFRTIRRLLTDDGIALLHSIGRAFRPGTTSAWIRKYIFPGGYIPTLSEVIPAIERGALHITDVEVLRLHYAETLRHWSRRFAQNRARVAELYDERFCRMWEFYLAASETAFRRLDHMVFQVQLTRRQEAAPLTREYIEAWERAHRPAPERIRALSA